MTFFTELQGANRGLPPRLLYGIVMILISFIFLDLFLHHSSFSGCSKLVLDSDEIQEDGRVQEFLSTEKAEDISCSSLEGHLAKTLKPQNPKEDPWNQMKWIGEPAKCRVKGQLIESLDQANNFRRGFSLQFATDVEDKTHILPWLLGSKIDLNQRKRRVYLDLGANSFYTSIQWFMKMYPCDFTEVHAFEVQESLLKFPQVGFPEDSNWKPENPQSIRVKVQPSIPQWMLKRMKVYYNFVSDFDDASTKSINITRFIKEELKLTAADTLVIKMDIEGSEWPILNRWMQDSDMAETIDELFVEIHYSHPTMLHYHWARFGGHTREQATRLIAGLRSKGFYIHAWP